MSSKHLVSGDPLPPIKDGSILLLSMAYCPYAQRVQLVMSAKGVQYDVVNCNLDNKPQFFLERNPMGIVPTIDRGGQVLWESEIICNLLEEWYPDVPLYPKDPHKKAQDQVVSAAFNSKVIPSFYKVLLLRGTESAETVKQYKQEFGTTLKDFTQELKTRGTKFFAGNDKPGMLDFLCWPWIEKTTFVDNMKEVVDSIPELKTYVDEMMKLKLVKDIICDKNNYLGFAESYAAGKRKYEF